MFQFPKNKRIINIKENSPSGQILLQGTSDIEYFYSQLRYFLEEKLLTSMKDVENIERVQSILNIPAHKVGQLGKYSFDPDVRIGELIILIGIYCTFKNLNTIEFEYIPGWQVPNQKAIVKKHFKKESLDGYILTAQNDEVIALPLELKSLMQNPNEPMEKTPIDQLKEKLSGFSKHFQQTGGIYCVLVMPYSIEKSLSIDLKEAIPLFKKSMTPNAVGIIALLSFPTDKKGYTSIAYDFILINNDLINKNEKNHKHWLRHMTFSKKILSSGEKSVTATF